MKKVARWTTRPLFHGVLYFFECGTLFSSCFSFPTVHQVLFQRRKTKRRYGVYWRLVLRRFRHCPGQVPPAHDNVFGNKFAQGWQDTLFGHKESGSVTPITQNSLFLRIDFHTRFIAY
jgi:hypothetical protein